MIRDSQERRRAVGRLEALAGEGALLRITNHQSRITALTHHRNSNADSTKLNISTSSEALTTARVVASEVPSIVGSAK